MRAWACAHVGGRARGRVRARVWLWWWWWWWWWCVGCVLTSAPILCPIADALRTDSSLLMTMWFGANMLSEKVCTLNRVDGLSMHARTHALTHAHSCVSAQHTRVADPQCVSMSTIPFSRSLYCSPCTRPPARQPLLSPCVETNAIAQPSLRPRLLLLRASTAGWEEHL